MEGNILDSRGVTRMGRDRTHSQAIYFERLEDTQITMINSFLPLDLKADPETGCGLVIY